MVWRAHGRGDDLYLVVDVLAAPVIVTNAGNNICKLGNAVFGDIVEPPDKRADVARAGVSGQQRLRGGEHQRHVDAHAFVRKLAARLKARLANRQLDDNVRSERGQAQTLLDHAVRRGCSRLGGNGKPFAKLGDLEHMGFKIREFATRLCVQRGIGGDAGKAAPALRFCNLIQIGGIDEELHDETSYVASRYTTSCPHGVAHALLRYKERGVQ